jgi:hypothetical protein
MQVSKKEVEVRMVDVATYLGLVPQGSGLERSRGVSKAHWGPGNRCFYWSPMMLHGPAGWPLPPA